MVISTYFRLTKLINWVMNIIKSWRGCIRRYHYWLAISEVMLAILFIRSHTKNRMGGKEEVTLNIAWCAYNTYFFFSLNWFWINPTSVLPGLFRHVVKLMPTCIQKSNIPWSMSFIYIMKYWSLSSKWIVLNLQRLFRWGLNFQAFFKDIFWFSSTYLNNSKNSLFL